MLRIFKGTTGICHENSRLVSHLCLQSCLTEEASPSTEAHSMVNTDCQTAGFRIPAEISEEEPVPFRADRHSACQRVGQFWMENGGGGGGGRGVCLPRMQTLFCVSTTLPPTPRKAHFVFVNSNHMTWLISAIFYLQTGSFQNRKHFKTGLRVSSSSSSSSTCPQTLALNKCPFRFSALFLWVVRLFDVALA